MKKELIKLAFQLGYNQGLEDLNKQASNAMSRLGYTLSDDGKRVVKLPPSGNVKFVPGSIGDKLNKMRADEILNLAENGSAADQAMARGTATFRIADAKRKSRAANRLIPDGSQVGSKTMKVIRRSNNKNIALAKALAKNKRLALALGIGGGVGTAGAGLLGYLAGKGKSTED